MEKRHRQVSSRQILTRLVRRIRAPHGRAPTPANGSESSPSPPLEGRAGEEAVFYRFTGSRSLRSTRRIPANETIEAEEGRPPRPEPVPEPPPRGLEP